MFIKKAFIITKENIILAQPLVLYLVIISITMAGLAQVPNKIAYYTFLLANILLTTAFFAGWMYMTAKTIEHSRKEFEKPEEKSFESVKLIREFFPGVGEFFVPITFAIALYLGGYALVLFLGYKLGTHILPAPDVDFGKMLTAQTPEQMQKFIMTLSMHQLKVLNIWFAFMGAVSTIYTFLTMFLFPALIYDSKNPFIAFWKNLKFIFKNFLGSLGVMFFLLALNMFISALSVLLNINVILSIIGLVLSFYFMTYCMILIFLYYEEKR